ncbi:MAG: DUF917 family protein [Candidatus Caldarchaeum sp.]
MLRIDESLAEAAVLGGAFFGGGGGGEISLGLKYAKLAVESGDVIIVDIDEVTEGLIATASIIGAPSAREKHVSAKHILKSAEMLIDMSGEYITGFITSENGGMSTVNGWIPSAFMDIPVVDAPADGRAHPTGVMGSMGLHKVKNYVSIQAAVGGREESGQYVEVFAKGSLDKVDKIIREASVQAGGMVAVTRNPVSPNYVKENAAVGGLKLAIEVGKIFQKYRGDGERIVENIVKKTAGKLIDSGVVESVTLESKGGYDVGTVQVRGVTGTYLLTFWNEYMTLEKNKNERLATFPDLIVTLSSETGLPIASAEISKGQKITIVIVPREKIPLGSGVRDIDLLKRVENIIQKKMV